jgi:Tol biopolymer transport system component
VHDQQTGQITPVSVDSSGNEGNSVSRTPSISADGRFVAFESHASNLVPGDTNDGPDVFVHDRQTGQTTRVSVDSSGTQANARNFFNPSISADGRFVVFSSDADNLVLDDTNDRPDVFVHDRQTGQTTRVSVDSSGNEANGHSGNVSSISADGRFVAFSSSARNLVPGIMNIGSNIFVHDRQTGQTTRVSVDSMGNEFDASCSDPSISADGRFVAFYSFDANDREDIFVHDRQTGQTTRVPMNGFSISPSISADGRFVAFESRDQVWVHDQQTGQIMPVSEGRTPSISADGRFVAFVSYANNLVPGDTNDEQDVFVHDRQTGQTTRVSVDSSGNQANAFNFDPSISADGRFVAFVSSANNLVPEDSNEATDIFVRDLRPTSRVCNCQSPNAILGGPADDVLLGTPGDDWHIYFAAGYRASRLYLGAGPDRRNNGLCDVSPPAEVAVVAREGF